MLLADRSRLAANTARRTNGNRTELRRGVYSPCDLCKNDPSAPPAWQLKAREIDHDKELQLIEFRDATMEIDGWPVFYSPYISAPDPSVKRASGFLIPSVGGSNTLGANVTIPYYLVLGPDKDLTLSPRFMTKAGALLAADYRQRFGNGTLDAIASLNHSDVGSGSSSSSEGEQWRGHINEHSVFDLDETYRTGLDVQRVSDQTYLLRFGFGNPLLNAMISRGLSRRLRAARLDRHQHVCLFSRCCPASETRPNRSSCRSPIAIGKVSRTRSAGGGTSTPMFSTSCAKSAPRPDGCRSDRNGTERSATGSAGNIIFRLACAAMGIRSPI